MKFIILGLTLLVAAVYAQNLPEVLVRRAEWLVATARHELQRHHSEGRQHLTVELEKQVHEIEALEKELKALPHGQALESHHAHQLEERLLHAENKLGEELARIAGHNENAVHDRHHLVQVAEALLARAKHDLQRHRDAGRGHLVAAIEHEVHLITELVHELRTHHSSELEASHGHQIEQRLADHERRLAEELRRIEGTHTGY